MSDNPEGELELSPPHIPVGSGILPITRRGPPRRLGSLNRVRPLSITTQT
jgi:hypothetical protein